MRVRYSTGRAFTLVEILVVVGVIGILVALLMPALNRARSAADSAKCLANLRQVGIAQDMYADANKGRYTMLFVPIGIAQQAAMGMDNDTRAHYQTYWHNRLAPQLRKILPSDPNGLKQDPNFIFWCPATEKGSTPFTSGSSSIGFNGFLANVPRINYQRVKVRRPSEIILAGDMLPGSLVTLKSSDGFMVTSYFASPNNQWASSDPWMPTNAWPNVNPMEASRPAIRHGSAKWGPTPETTQGYGNYIFVDGHAGPLTSRELKLSPRSFNQLPAAPSNPWCWW